MAQPVSAGLEWSQHHTGANVLLWRASAAWVRLCEQAWRAHSSSTLVHPHHVTQHVTSSPYNGATSLVDHVF